MAEKKEFALGDYIDVAERIQAFKKDYPEGTLQQRDLQFIQFGGKSWVVYTAAAYRTPDDERPAIGTAWEEVPGKTPYTRDSEVQNAETAAWGRAIVALGLAASGRIASRQEVEASQQRQQAEAEVNRLKRAIAVRLPGVVPTEIVERITAFAGDNGYDDAFRAETLSAFLATLPAPSDEQAPEQAPDPAEQVARATSGRTK